MIKKYEILDWDTKHFGYKVAKVDANNIGLSEYKELIIKLSKKGVKLMYFFADLGDNISIKTAKTSGGFLADEKVVYIREVPIISKPENLKNITSHFKKPLTSQIKLLALEAGKYSRYKIDPNFMNGEFEKLYTEWIKKSLNGEIAKDVLVYEINKKNVGLITLGDKDGKCNIGLIAIHPEHRNKGIGTNLVNAGFVKAAGWGYKKIDVVTQKSNFNAGKFYESLGFKVKSIVNIYHFWL